MGFLPAWFVFKMPAKGDSEIKNKKSLIEKAQDTWDYLRICCYNPENGTCLTRTPFNWLKISLFTILYYAVLFTTTFIFFTLFLQIKYQDDSKPVEVAPDNIWPTLLEHPDLAIKLTNDACTPCLDITINKLFNWKPEVYSSTDMPPRVKAMLTKIGVTPDFSKEMVYVTCSERADEQKTCLDGMKIKGNTTSFLASYFPYSNEKKDWPKMVIDLSQTSGVFQQSSSKNSNPSSTCPGKTTVTLECRAWAKNIKHSATNVLPYRGIPKGG